MTDRWTRGRVGILLRVAVLLGVGGALIPVAPAYAADSPEVARQKAKELVDEGVQLYEQGRYQEALDRFRSAHGIFDSDKIYFNIGEALTSMDLKVEAAEAFDKFLVGTATDTSDAGTKKRTIALKAMQDFNRELARLKIEVLPSTVANAMIDIDTGTRIVRPGVVYVYKGRHLIKASAPGAGEDSQTILVDAGQQMPISLNLHPGTAVAPPVAAPLPATPPPAQNSTVTPPIVIGPDTKAPLVLAPQPDTQKPDTAWQGAQPVETKTAPAPAPTSHSRLPSYILWGVAGAGVIAGTIWGVKVLNDNNNLNVGLSTVQQEEHIADAIWGGAVLAGAAGTVWFFVAKPSPSGSGGEVGVGGSF